ncbi:MAG TPA: sugar transferase [Candidatus Paceibacterota bacterium]|nr:sugar transferase [Candidatus Paceibacterota bacterium]
MKKLTLVLTDLVAFYGSLALVLLVRYGPDRWDAAYDVHVGPFSILFLVWLFSFYIANLYEERVLRAGSDFYGRLIQAVVVAAAISVAFFYLIPYFVIAPKLNLFLFIVVFAFVWAGARTLANQSLAAGSKKRILMIGATKGVVDVARFVALNPQLGWSVNAVARLGQDELPLADASGPWDVLDDRTDLVGAIHQRHIDTVVIAPHAFVREDLVAMLYRSIMHGVDFQSLAGFTESVTGTVPLDAIDQQWFLQNFAEGSKRSYEPLKRAVDVVAATMLGIPALILTPFIALAVKLSSPGPVLFRQERSGRGSVPFTMLKFRTMRADAERGTGAVWAKPKDPRVTRVGRFLRATRLDELPQLWNVIRGDMSMVGPRAERPELDTTLAAQIPFYHDRYLTRPGLSGWAQINYPYGGSVQDATRKLEYDLYYLKRRSFALDLEIILKTVSIALRREGR